MKISIKRKYLKESYTVGHMCIDGVYFCDTLEDRNRDLNRNGIFDNGETKVFDNTCIPYGNYKIVVTYSNKFKRKMPLLLRVSSFDGIRIHWGNTAADTAGCILVGQNKIKGRLINSKYVFERLFAKIEDAIKKGEDITLSIT